MYICVRAHVRACVRACMRACPCPCLSACLSVCQSGAASPPMWCEKGVASTLRSTSAKSAGQNVVDSLVGMGEGVMGLLSPRSSASAFLDDGPVDVRC